MYQAKENSYESSFIKDIDQFSHANCGIIKNDYGLSNLVNTGFRLNIT